MPVGKSEISAHLKIGHVVSQLMPKADIVEMINSSEATIIFIFNNKIDQ